MTKQSQKSRGGSGATGNAAGTTVEDTDTNTDDETSPEVSRDLVFDALKNSRRRLALRYLHEQAQSVALNDLVEHVAAVENDTTPADLTSDQRKRVYVGLYQSHLPRLDDMGFVEFDPDTGEVELGPAGGSLEQYLFVDEDDRTWYRNGAEFVAIGTVVLGIGAAIGLVDGFSAIALFAGMTLGAAGLVAYRRMRQADE